MDEAASATRWNPVGTGPYKFASYQKNDRIELEAFDAYWGGAPAAAKVVFRSVPEVAARVAGLVSGDYDIAVEIPPDQWDVIKGYPDLVLKTRPLENSHLLVFNMSDPVMADKKLRHALSLAIDRKALIDALWKGQTYTPNGHQLPSFDDLYLIDRPGYAYDPELAKKMLAESSYKGQELVYRLIPNYYTYNVEAAQILQEMWRAIGINVRIDFVDSFKEVRKPGVQIYAWSNTYRIPDPTGALIANWGPLTATQRENKHFVAPPRFNELAEILFNASDLQQRRAAFAEILDLFEDAMPMTMLYNPVAGYAMKKSIDWKPYTQFYMDFRPDNLKISAK